jgi:hypothetical protein
LDATPVVLKCRLEAVEVLEVNVSHGGIGGRTASVAEEAFGYLDSQGTFPDQGSDHRHMGFRIVIEIEMSFGGGRIDNR